MRTKNVAFLALILPFSALAQLDDNTLTVTSTSNINLQPDQVTFSVNAGFEPSATLDDVLAAVESVGITEANLSNVSTSNADLGFPQTTGWLFVLPVPFAKLGNTLSALATLQQSIEKTPSRSLTYSVTGTQISPQLQASAACPYPALFQDATAQARTLASAAGVMLGAVVAISDGTGASALNSPSAYAVIFDPLVVGVPSAAYRLATSYLVPTSPSSQATCTMTVQFTLLH